MPAVMVLANPKGEPIAATHCPGSRFDDLPRLATGKPEASTLMSATSVRSSAPMTFALNSRLASARRTVTSPAPETTCALVRM
jgi:hypothetical protein